MSNQCRHVFQQGKNAGSTCSKKVTPKDPHKVYCSSHYKQRKEASASLEEQEQQPQPVFSMDHELEQVEEEGSDSGEEQYEEVENDDEKEMNSSQMFPTTQPQQTQIQYESDSEEEPDGEEFSVLLSEIQQQLKGIAKQRDVNTMRAHLQSLHKDIQHIKSGI